MRKAIIALDYTSMDEFIIKNSKSLLDTCGIEELTFIHVIPNYLNVNNLELEGLKVSAQPAEKLVSELIKQKVEQVYNCDGSKYKVSCKILEGSPYGQLIKYIKANPTDLLVTGKKHRSKGSGITAKRIAHHVACNVLFVTEEPTSNIDVIGVPIDFSQNSVRALNYAISIAGPTSVIKPLHVISHTPTDHYLGLNYNSTYREMYLNAAKSEYHKILTKNNINTPMLDDVTFLEDTSNSVAKHLLDYFNSERFDLIVMGARGHNALDTILYGSVAEKFVDHNDFIPTLIIR